MAGRDAGDADARHAAAEAGAGTLQYKHHPVLYPPPHHYTARHAAPPLAALPDGNATLASGGHGSGVATDGRPPVGGGRWPGPGVNGMETDGGGGSRKGGGVGSCRGGRQVGNRPWPPNRAAAGGQRKRETATANRSDRPIHSQAPPPLDMPLNACHPKAAASREQDAWLLLLACCSVVFVSPLLLAMLMSIRLEFPLDPVSFPLWLYGFRSVIAEKEGGKGVGGGGRRVEDAPRLRSRSEDRWTRTERSSL